MTDRRVIVADDEPLARERLSLLLSRHEGWRIVAECGDGVETLEAVERERPDLAFLDISMPGHSGVEVAHALLDRDRAPAIVFVTAHDQFALQAFEVSAMDYLVKPVDRERFDQMLARVERRLAGAGHGPRADDLLALIEQLREGGSHPRRFAIRSAKGHYFVRTESIEWARADGNYVALAAEGRTHLLRETMKTFETRLDPARFVRIHRSVIVAIDRIQRLEPLGHGAYRVTMQGGARFEASPRYNARIQALLE
jgi:two-component system, LytTR family, response regulator